MNSMPVNELTLYRYRYFIGYTLLAILAVGLLLLNYHILPPGLSAGEEDSVLTSSGIIFNIHLSTIGPDLLHFLLTTNTVNLPYHLLQRLSLHFFGLSPLGVRLPSTALAIASIFMFFTLLTRWMHRNIAIVASTLTATSSWFLSISRLGTPDIMVIFWTLLILLLATLASQESKYIYLWKALSLLCIGLSLYTPYTAYLFIAATIATITQPHLRYIVHYAGRVSITVGSILFIVILIPLGFNIWSNPDATWQLLGVTAQLPGPLPFLSSFMSSLGTLLNPFHASYDIAPLPLISIPIASLAVIGLACLLQEWHSVRSHVLLTWTAILIPLVGFDTSHNLVVLFVPIMLFAALGTQWLIRYWYIIFPRNPYARVFGLLPIGLLIFTIVQFNYTHYFNGLPYAQTTVSLYDEDPFILTGALTSKTYNNQHMTLIVPADKVALYSIDQSVTNNMTVVDPNDFTTAADDTHVIVAVNALPALTPAQQALLPSGKTELLVNDRKNNGLRFTIYSIF